MKIDHHHGQDRPELDDHIEHLYKGFALFQLDKLLHQDQMPCAADGKPLCNPFHNPQNNDF